MTAAILFLGGCAGGGGGSSPKIKTVAATYKIDWAARTRDLGAPSSALSATIDLGGATVQGVDALFEVDRATGPAAYQQTYTTSPTVTLGTHPLTVTFYSKAHGVGTVVGTGHASVTIAADGSGIGTVATLGAVAFVEVVPALPITTTPVQLFFSAKDASGAVLTLSPGSAKWTQLDGTDHMTLTPDGIATGTSNGLTQIQVSVDGVLSLPAMVFTNTTTTAHGDFNNSGFEAPVLAAGQSVAGGATGWGGTLPWGIANGSGAWGTGGHSGSQYAYIQAQSVLGPHIGAMTQTVSDLVVGKTYKVTFWMAQRNGNANANTPAPMRVFANDAQIFGPVSPSLAWSSYTTSTFTATDTTCTFKFQPDGPPLPGHDTADLLDDLHLVAVP